MRARALDLNGMEPKAVLQVAVEFVGHIIPVLIKSLHSIVQPVIKKSLLGLVAKIFQYLPATMLRSLMDSVGLDRRSVIEVATLVDFLPVYKSATMTSQPRYYDVTNPATMTSLTSLL